MNTRTDIQSVAPPPLPLAVAPAPSFEVAVSAAAAQAKATVLARYEMALRKPRNWDQVRADVLHECRRPSFALDKSAFYRKPIGQGVEGLGIRFVEMALRCMANVLIEQEVRYEDEQKEVIRITVTDLEANVTWPGDITVRKTVERSKPMDDGSYLSVRSNSYGNLVYTVPATDDDLLNKRAALVSKAVRTIGLRVIPGDIQSEGEAMIKEVRLAKVKADPDAEQKRLADAFGELRVSPRALAEYLGHEIATCDPHELVKLRGLYGAIRDGETTWREIMDNKRQQEGSGEGGPPPPPPPPSNTRAPRKSDESPADAPPPAADSGLEQATMAMPEQLRAAITETASSRAATGSEKGFILARAKERKVGLLDLLQRNEVSSSVDPDSLAGITHAEYLLLKADLS